jgi:hypothetical protein
MLVRVAKDMNWTDTSGETLWADWKAFLFQKHNKLLFCNIHHMFPEQNPHYVPRNIIVAGKYYSVTFTINDDLTYNPANIELSKWVYTPRDSDILNMPICKDYKIYLYRSKELGSR